MLFQAIISQNIQPRSPPHRTTPLLHSPPAATAKDCFLANSSYFILNVRSHILCHESRSIAEELTNARFHMCTRIAGHRLPRLELIQYISRYLEYRRCIYRKCGLGQSKSLGINIGASEHGTTWRLSLSRTILSNKLYLAGTPPCGVHNTQAWLKPYINTVSVLE